MSFFTLEGMSREHARRQIYLVDSQGLVYNARGRLPEHKKCMSELWNELPSDMTESLSDFSRDDYQGPPITKLIDIIQHVKPTALLGLSTIGVCTCPFLSNVSVLTIF